jgi:hypothetical protein
LQDSEVTHKRQTAVGNVGADESFQNEKQTSFWQGTLRALPLDVEMYTALQLPAQHLLLRRFSELVSQSAPVLSMGMTLREVETVNSLIMARLVLDAAQVAPGSPADEALDVWLAHTLLRASRHETAQRRAWWHVERMAILTEALSRWARLNLVRVEEGATVQNNAHLKTLEPLIFDMTQHWIALGAEIKQAGPEMEALFGFTVSENLLDCARVYGSVQAISLRRAQYLLQRASAAAAPTSRGL